MSDTVTISRAEYEELKMDAEKWRKHREAVSAGANKTNSKLSPEQRSANARKAALARVAKYGQKRRK